MYGFGAPGPFGYFSGHERDRPPSPSHWPVTSLPDEAAAAPNPMLGAEAPDLFGLGGYFGDDQKRAVGPAEWHVAAPPDDTGPPPSLLDRSVKRLRDGEEAGPAAARDTALRRRLAEPDVGPPQAPAIALATFMPLQLPAHATYMPLQLHAQATWPTTAAAASTQAPVPQPMAAEDEAAAAGLPIWPMDPADQVRKHGLFQTIDQHLSDPERSRDVHQLGHAIKAWFGAKPKVGHLKEGLAVVLRTLQCVPPHTHHMVMTALASAVGTNETTRIQLHDTLSSVPLHPYAVPHEASAVHFPGDPGTERRRVELARLSAHVFGIGFRTYLGSKGRDRHVITTSSVYEGFAIWLLEKEQAPAAPTKGARGRTKAAYVQSVEQLVDDAVSSYIKDKVDALASAVGQVHRQRPIGAALFERIVTAMIALHDREYAKTFAVAMARALCHPHTRNLDHEHEQLLTQRWNAARGTDSFCRVSSMVFPMLHPHDSLEQLVDLALAMAATEPSATDAAQLLFGVIDAHSERRTEARDNLLSRLIDRGAKEELLVAVADQAATRWEKRSRWGDQPSQPCSSLFDGVLAQCHRLPASTVQRLGAACAGVSKVHAAASLMRLFEGRAAPTDEQMRAWPGLFQGYFEGLLAQPRSMGKLAAEIGQLVQYQRSRTDSKGPASVQPVSAATVGMGLAAHGDPAHTSALLRTLFPLLKEAPSLAAEQLMQDWLQGFTQKEGGLTQPLVQALTDALDVASKFTPAMPGYAAVFAAAQRAVDASLFVQASAEAGPFDTPANAAIWSAPLPARGGKAAIARAIDFVGQARELAAAAAAASADEVRPALPAISPMHRRAVALWESLRTERRLLADAGASAEERGQALTQLNVALQALQVFIRPDRATQARSADAAAATLRALQARRIRQSPKDWHGDSVALAWRLGLHQMPAADQNSLLAVRVDRLTELGHTLPSTRQVDPILRGLFQVASSPAGRLDTDRAALGRHLATAVFPDGWSTALAPDAWASVLSVVASSAHGVDDEGAGLARSVRDAMPPMLQADSEPARLKAKAFATGLSRGLQASESEQIAKEIVTQFTDREALAPLLYPLISGLSAVLHSPSARGFGQVLAPVLARATELATERPEQSKEMLRAVAQQLTSDSTPLGGEVFAQATRRFPLDKLVALLRLIEPVLRDRMVAQLVITPPMGSELSDALSRAEVFKLAYATALSQGADPEALRTQVESADRCEHRDLFLTAIAAVRTPASLLASRHLADDDKIRLLRELLELKGKLSAHSFNELRSQIFKSNGSPQVRAAALSVLGYARGVTELRPEDFAETRALMFDLLREMDPCTKDSVEERTMEDVERISHITGFYAQMGSLPPSAFDPAFLASEERAIRRSGLSELVINHMTTTLAQVRPAGAAVIQADGVRSLDSEDHR